jgi:hypothetical protein
VFGVFSIWKFNFSISNLSISSKLDVSILENAFVTRHSWHIDPYGFLSSSLIKDKILSFESMMEGGIAKTFI